MRDDIRRFQHIARDEGWNTRVNFTTNVVEVEFGNMQVAFHTAAFDSVSVDYVVDRIEEEFRTLPNDKTVKKSKRFSYLKF